MQENEFKARIGKLEEEFTNRVKDKEKELALSEQKLVFSQM